MSLKWCLLLKYFSRKTKQEPELNIKDIFDYDLKTGQKWIKKYFNI